MTVTAAMAPDDPEDNSEDRERRPLDSLASEAVEDAVIPVLLPTDQGATRGKLIIHLCDVAYTLPFQRKHADVALGAVPK